MNGAWREEKAPGFPLANMVADEELFQAVRQGTILMPTVRLYLWDRPAVSYGRLQDEAVVQKAFPGLPCVRRPTGGLAVVHGDDLTLTVVTHQNWLPPSAEHGVLASYRQIMSGVLAALGATGIPATLGSSDKKHRPDGTINCFAATAACDAVDSRTGRKLVGSAQRRQDGALLQQMSVPLDVLPHLGQFRGQIRDCLRPALGIDQWLFVDSLQPV